MGIYNLDLIYSWTYREYTNFLKGARLSEIDHRENLSISAIFNAQASNAKRTSAKKLYDADKARRQIEQKQEEIEKDIKRSMHLNDAFKGFIPQFKEKGGS